MTYLDPHPSHGDNVAPFSTTTQFLLNQANFLQTIFQDPYPLTVPSQVAVAQIDYENTPVSLIEPLSEEGQVNPWGITNPSGIQAAPGASTQFQQLNLTTPGMTHSGVYQWYQANVVPTLATASPFVTGPIDAPIVANGYNTSADVDSILPLRVAYFSDLNPQLSAGDFTAQINWGDRSETSTGLVAGLPALGYYVLGIHAYSSPGTYPYTVTIQHDGGSMATASGTVNVTPAILVSGAPAGQAPLVSISQAGNGELLSQFPAFGPRVKGGVRVASADVNGDGTPDLIAATGPGTPGSVRVFDGKDHHLIRQFRPFGRGYRGGLTVSAGQMDSDGNADLAVASVTGAIKVFSGSDGSLLARFHARVGGASFRRGTGLNVADVDQDGLGDVVIAAPNGSTRHVITGRSLALRRANAQFASLHHLRFSHAAAPESFLSLAGTLRFLRRGIVHR